MRRLFVSVIVLLIIGVVPATSVMGFCAKMPCCSPSGSHSATTIGLPDCCDPVSCSDTSAFDVSLSPASKSLAKTSAVLIVSIVVNPTAPLVAAREIHISGSPPRTAERLSSLSTLRV